MAGRTGSGARGRAYTTQEDVVLCQVWICVTQDPVVGTDQSGAQFWGRVLTTFTTILGIPNDRTTSSVSSRFHLISKEVALFIAKLGSVTNRAASGSTEADKMRDARIEYSQTSGKPFKFEACYDILKDQPKFSLRTTQIFDRFMASGSPQVECGSSQNSPSMNISDSDIPVDMESPTPLTRPPGRKAQKRKGKNLAESSTEYSQMVLESQNFNAMYKENAERRNTATEIKIAIKQKDHDLRQQVEDDSIMKIDLNTLPDSQRYYFMCRQNNILQKSGYNRG